MTMHIMKSDDFLSLEILQDLSELLVAAGAEPLDLSMGLETLPTADFINGIEGRISALSGGLAQTKTWHGADADNQWLDYRDVNRWFDNLKNIIGGV
ncbi:MAG: hypothetical protein FWB98_09085 [Defluviitaleaceae bacterium]|nr:hypothetical protein [Defluviitaleaceae bacterium]